MSDLLVLVHELEVSDLFTCLIRQISNGNDKFAVGRLPFEYLSDPLLDRCSHPSLFKIYSACACFCLVFD